MFIQGVPKCFLRESFNFSPPGVRVPMGQMRLPVRGIVRLSGTLREGQGEPGPRAGLLPGQPRCRAAVPVEDLPEAQQEEPATFSKSSTSSATRQGHAHQQRQRKGGAT